MNTQVVCSVGVRFPGGSIGNIAHHAVSSLYRRDMLLRLLCGSSQKTEIPRERIRAMGWPSRVIRKIAVYDLDNRIDYAYRLLYDRWAARQLTPCDVFYCWDGYGLQTIRRAKGMGIPVILDRPLAHPFYVHQILEKEFTRWGLKYRWPATAYLTNQEIELADYVVIPSQFVFETFVQEGVDEKKLILIPFGVDLQRFRPPSSSNAHPFRALFVGQVSLRKGVHILLEAWESLGWDDAELWLAGQIMLPAALERRFKNLKGVRFLGHVSNIVEIFQEVNVFVFPSLAEGSALVTYEAMACGLPVLVTSNAGSVARDGVDGFIVPPRDAETVASRLEQMRADENLTQRMGRVANEWIQKYPWERYENQVPEVIRSLASPQGDIA